MALDLMMLEVRVLWPFCLQTKTSRAWRLLLVGDVLFLQTDSFYIRFRAMMTASILKPILSHAKKFSLRQQIEAAHHVRKLNQMAEQKKAEVLRRTYACLSEANGIIF